MNPLQTCPNEYVFPDDGIGDLQGIFSQLAGGTLHEELTIAVHRLNSAVERNGIEDSFIDHVIALEAVFGDADTLSSSLTYKVFMRATVFLASNLEERKSIVKTLKEGLKLRGKVMHGAARLTPADTELISKVADLARKAVRSAMLDIYAKGNKISGAYFDDLLLE
jgi:hypothetical protein